MRRASTWLALLACMLVATSCGARLTDEQMAAALAEPTASGSAGSGGTGQATATSVATSGGGGATTGGSAATAGSAGSGGTAATAPGAGGAEGPTGPSGGAVGAACTPQPSSEVGVTDTEIRLGNVSTITGPIAGFGTTGVNGVKAYFNYINSQGGVCGRQLTLVTGDDRLDAGSNRSSAEQLVGETFGFVGGTTVVDSGLAGVLEGTNVVSTALAISDPATRSANTFSPLPIDPDSGTQGTDKIFSYFAAQYGITRVAVVYPAQADARARAQTYISDIERAGLAVDGPYEVAITETNYVAVAQQIENNGADAIITALEITGISRLAQAFRQIQYTPTVAYYGSQAYGAPFLDLAGEAAEGARLGIAHAIFEDAPTIPIVAAFNEWYARTAPGSDPDFFAIMGWTAADMMVQALEAAGPAPTRDAVLSFLQGLHSFDAHGFLAPNDPAAKVASSTFMVVTVQNGQWVREYPAGTGFGAG